MLPEGIIKMSDVKKMSKKCQTYVYQKEVNYKNNQIRK